jgi:acyl-coenzyme A synthetase/AMP-(fatty) acid ligase
MRSPLLLLAMPLLLAGCVNESASYSTANGAGDLTVVVTQDVFWSKQAALRLIASRLPDCQRQHALGKVPLAGLNVELFSTGEDKFLLRVDDEMWQVETGGCAKLPAPSDDVQAQPIGVFHFDKKKKLVFEPAEGASR